jgi:hypothetical protein
MFAHALSLAGNTSSASHWSLATTITLLISILSFGLAAVALFVSLRDRRPMLFVRARKGDWAKLQVTQTGKDVIFQGIIEIYNRSSRANAIREYAFFCKPRNEWVAMESERYMETSNSETTVQNVTPLALPPYSGVEVYVMAFTKTPLQNMPVRIDVEDIFGKRYSVEVAATKKF